MKLIILFLLLVSLISCSNKEYLYPKFHYGDNVKVKSGFYLGRREWIKNWSYCVDRKLDETIICYNNSTLYEKELELIKK